MSFSVTYKAYGSNSILVSWEDTINEAISEDIYRFNHEINKQNSTNIIETVSCYTSLTVFYLSSINSCEIITWLKDIYKNHKEPIKILSKTWKIPVCYHRDYALDLSNLAQVKNITNEEVIHLHTKQIYTVDFIGFLPGFSYLSGLNKLLYTPRLGQPRTHVAKGSIAIGGRQTGIYPCSSPGGWHIIGRTHFELFNPNNSPPCLIKPFDKIQFIAISKQEFES